jgi:hypothetical protein
VSPKAVWMAVWKVLPKAEKSERKKADQMVALWAY